MLFGCLSDCNWTRTHNHLIHKQTLNHLAKLAKWLSCVVSTYLYGAFDCTFLSCHIHVSGWNIECGFTLKRVRDMRRTYNQLQSYTSDFSLFIQIQIWIISDFLFDLNSCKTFKLSLDLKLETKLWSLIQIRSWKWSFKFVWW